MFTIEDSNKVSFTSPDELRSFLSTLLTGVLSDFFDNAPVMLKKAQVFVAMMKNIAEQNRAAADERAIARYREAEKAKEAEVQELVKKRTEAADNYIRDLEAKVEALRKEIEEKNASEQGEAL